MLRCPLAATVAGRQPPARAAPVTQRHPSSGKPLCGPCNQHALSAPPSSDTKRATWHAWRLGAPRRTARRRQRPRRAAARMRRQAAAPRTASSPRHPAPAPRRRARARLGTAPAPQGGSTCPRAPAAAGPAHMTASGGELAHLDRIRGRGRKMRDDAQISCRGVSAGARLAARTLQSSMQARVVSTARVPSS